MPKHAPPAFNRRAVVGAFAAITLGGLDRKARALTDDVADWQAILDAYLAVGADGLNRFDYARLKASPQDRARLQNQITRWAGVRPQSLPPAAAFAYWCNLYNALTVAIVTDHFPVRSIREIGSGLLTIGPWKRELITVDGRALSLDDIEHGVLRKQWRDPRVHYAVNCASVGCPNLQPKAWRAISLDQELDAAARAFIAHPRGVEARPDGTIIASTIYDWFKVDFGGNDAGVLKHLRRYAAPDLAARLAQASRIAAYAYDWSVNAPGSGLRTSKR